MMGPTLLTRGEGLACIAGLWKVPVDPERELCSWKCLPSLQNEAAAPPLAYFYCQRKRSEGTVRGLV